MFENINQIQFNMRYIDKFENFENYFPKDNVKNFI